MNKQILLKKIEQVLNDKEIDDEGKMYLIMSYIKLSRKSNKKGSK